MEYKHRYDVLFPHHQYPLHKDDYKYSYHDHFYCHKTSNAVLNAMDMVNRAYVQFSASPLHYCCPCVCLKKAQLLHPEHGFKAEPPIRSRRRRNRTVYTDEQTSELEEVFKAKKYLDSEEKQQLAEKLEVKTENIEIWFKNRRSKWRKQGKTKLSTMSHASGKTGGEIATIRVSEQRWNRSIIQANR